MKMYLYDEYRFVFVAFFFKYKNVVIWRVRICLMTILLYDLQLLFLDTYVVTWPVLCLKNVMFD